MKRIFTVLLLLLEVCFTAQAGTGNWTWARNGIESYFYGAVESRVTTDKAGNIYTVGYYFSDSITFGSVTLHKSTAGDSGANADELLVKYDVNGDVKWAKSIPVQFSNFYYYSLSVVVDNAGNIYVDGLYGLDSIVLGSTVLHNYQPPYYDFFIAKFDSSGNVNWAGDYGGNAIEDVTGLATDVSNNLYLTGYSYSDTLWIGTIALVNADTTSYSDDAFLAKIGPGGDVLWAKNITGSGYDAGYGVSVSSSGDVYVMGYTSSDSLFFDTILLVTPDYNDQFIAKYDASGNPVWAKLVTGSLLSSDDYNSAERILCTGDSAVYLCGNFYSDTVVFDAHHFLVNTDTNQNREGIFLVRYDGEGNVAWASGGRGIDNQDALGMAADNQGNIYLSGYFYSSSLTFGYYTVYNTDQTDSTDDIFLVEYDSQGNPQGATSAGGNSFDESWGLATDADNNVYVSGFYISDTCNFGTLSLVNFTHAAPQNITGIPFLARSGSIATAINKVNANATLVVYPNPANEFLIAESSAFSGDNTPVIFDVSGRMLQVPYTLESEKAVFNVAGLAPGVYFVQFKADSISLCKKWVKTE